MNDLHEHVRALKENGTLSQQRIDADKGKKEKRSASRGPEKISEIRAEVYSTLFSACVLLLLFGWLSKSCSSSEEGRDLQAQHQRKVITSNVESARNALISESAIGVRKANEYHELMILLGATISANPSYSSTHAKITYQIDGRKITCIRGIANDFFSNDCDGMGTVLRKRFNLANLQMNLKELGYTPGKIDGYFGKQTSAAITEYQKDNNLEVTGETSPELEKEFW